MVNMVNVTPLSVERNITKRRSQHILRYWRWHGSRFKQFKQQMESTLVTIFRLSRAARILYNNMSYHVPGRHVLSCVRNMGPSNHLSCARNPAW